jgi:hypothetical protein
MAVLTASCQPPPGGSLSGHAYLVVASAEPRPAAGAEIYLLPRAEADSALQDICRRVESMQDSLLAAGDTIDGGQPETATTRRYAQLADDWHARRTAHFDQAMGALLRERVEIGRQLERIAIDSARAEVDGSYGIANLAAGTYQLFGEMVVEEKSYAWLTPVTLGKRDQRRQDLGNREEATKQVFCELDQMITVFQGFRHLEGVTRNLHEEWKILTGFDR